MESPRVKAFINGVFNHLSQITGRNPQCPFCANDEWSRTGGGRVVEIRIVADEKAVREPMYITALGFDCTNCGFLRLHCVDSASWGRPAAKP